MQNNKKALLILGDKWHAPAVINRAFGNVLEDRGWNNTTVFDYNVPFDRLSDFDLVIISRYALDDHFDNSKTKHLWITAEQENLLEEYVLRGGNILFHHDGISHFPKGGGVGRITKSFRVSHPPITEIKVIPQETQTNLCDGVKEFAIFDEEFLIEINEADTNVFLTSYSPQNGRSIQGFYHSCGKGHVTVFIPGHDDSVFRNPNIKKLISNILKQYE